MSGFPAKRSRRHTPPLSMILSDHTGGICDAGTRRVMLLLVAWSLGFPSWLTQLFTSNLIFVCDNQNTEAVSPAAPG